MVEGGQRWVPPPMLSAQEVAVANATAAQRGGEGPRERERQLSELERDKFEDMLRSVSVRRCSDVYIFLLCVTLVTHVVCLVPAVLFLVHGLMWDKSKDMLCPILGSPPVRCSCCHAPFCFLSVSLDHLNEVCYVGSSQPVKTARTSVLFF